MKYKVYVQDNESCMITYSKEFNTVQEAWADGERLVTDPSQCFWVEKERPLAKRPSL